MSDENVQSFGHLKNTPMSHSVPDARVFTLANEAGMRATVIDVGATLCSLMVPTPEGPVETLLGHAEPGAHAKDHHYLGSTVGRYANRLAKTGALIDGKRHTFEPSPDQHGHCLHGGPEGFSHRRWKIAHPARRTRLSLMLESPHGDQGFPGNVVAKVTYELGPGLNLRIMFHAESDQPTPLSLANHAYFNLNRDTQGIANHSLEVNADRFTPVNRHLIPTGTLASVANSPLDFRRPACLGDRLAAPHEQLRDTAGYDHNFVLNHRNETTVPAATLRSQESGLSLAVLTSQPGLQVYTGQHLSSPFTPFSGVCLEAQQFPDAPNHPAFPDAITRPGKPYSHWAEFRFTHCRPAR